MGVSGMSRQTAVLTVLTVTTIFYVVEVSGIGCFVCSSVNYSEPDCEDNFNNTGNFYTAICFARRPNRVGLFPATHCVKLKGTVADTGKTYMVRTCVVDSGGVNSDTELARSTHCGLVSELVFNEVAMKGCVLSCDTNGCNAAHTVRPASLGLLLALLVQAAWLAT